MTSNGTGVLEISLANKFSPSTRYKGHGYCFDYDCVCDLDIQTNRITGIVAGSRDYCVDLYYTRLNDAIKITSFACECPHFADGYNCKHIWAVILECDYLAASDPRWKQFLSGAVTSGNRLDQLLARISSPSQAAAVSAVPVHRDFLFGAARKQQTRLSYVFELVSGSLQLLLFKQKQKVNGEWGVAKRYKFEKDEIKSAPAESQQLLRLLTGYESPEDSGGSYSYRFDRAEYYETFEVISQWTEDVWKLLAESGQVFWSLDSDAGEDDWRKLVIDVERPYSLNLTYDEKFKTKTKVSVEITNGELTIPNDQIVHASSNGVTLAADRLFKVSNPELVPLLECVLQDELIVQRKDRAKFVELLDRIPNADRLPLPESWEIDKADVEPIVGIEFYQDGKVEVRLVPSIF